MVAQTYLHNEALSQFSDSKRDKIERLAKIKGYSVKPCQICQKPCMVKNLRETITLCHEHMGFSALVKNTLERRKRTTLNNEDIQGIIRSRTVSRGPYFKPTY